MITFLLGLYCGVCYTLNLEVLLDSGSNWRGLLSWLASPVSIPWRVYKFFRHPPIA